MITKQLKSVKWILFKIRINPYAGTIIKERVLCELVQRS